MSDNNFLSKITKLKKPLIITAVILALFFGFYVYSNNDDETIDNDLIISTIDKSSELTSVKLHFKDIIEYEEGSIPYINKASFSMSYEAVARIGIDFKKVNIAQGKDDNGNKFIEITIPKAEVFDISINHKSIKFYDEKNAIFKDEKNNTVEGLELAKKAAMKEIPKMGVLEAANQQAVLLIKGMFKNDSFKDYKIIVKVKK